MEKVIVQFNIPGMTSKVYDQIWDELRKAGQSHPAGLHYHVGAQQGDSWLVVDVWESADAFNKFGETLMPILAKSGVNMDSAKPVITPVHYEYEAALVHWGKQIAYLLTPKALRCSTLSTAGGKEGKK